MIIKSTKCITGFDSVLKDKKIRITLLGLSIINTLNIIPLITDGSQEWDKVEHTAIFQRKEYQRPDK